MARCKPRLIELLRKRAYREGDFVLSSGERSSYYLDVKQLTYHPEGLPLVSRAVLELLAPYRVDAVGGPTMGADAIVAGVVSASSEDDHPVSGFVIRKEPKKHGTRNWLEGILEPGWTVAVVDDVITTGGSVIRAVERIREVGAKVVAVCTLVDRMEGGREAVEELGVEFLPVTTIQDIRPPGGRGPRPVPPSRSISTASRRRPSV